MNKITAKVEALRKQLLNENLQAYYISCTDPHSSEYLPDYWKAREYVSGFTGSYGEILITMDHAILWTDTRYFIQAENQLAETCFEMQKLRVPDAVTFDQWIVQNLPKNARIGTSAITLPYSTAANLKKQLAEAEMELVYLPDLLDNIWDNRPPLPNDKVFELDKAIVGISRNDKLKLIAQEIEKSGADIQVVSMLDELAWSFNLRGSDVAYNPVFIAYAIIGKNKNFLFLENEKISAELKAKLESEDVVVLPYNEIFTYLGQLDGQKILLDAGTVNTAIVNAISDSCEIVFGNSVPTKLKAIKNSVEIEGFKSAMVKDGVALLKFHYWLKNAIGKEKITEFSVGRKIAGFRAEQKEFMGESFPPIVGYKDHGAMVHLIVGEENALPVEKEGILLFDSGGQYLHGTTDITRTVVLGEITDQQKKDFTLVLKGMIALTMVQFPEGTKGCHLDILARKALWDHGLNYGHGTGHGVGHFLAVHEGPMAIRAEYNENAIVPGMVMSNEPAMYRTGKYGLRTENMMVCVEREETGFGQFFGFETLSLCPIEKQLLDVELLTKEEISWLNNYHLKVRETLTPLIDDELVGYLNELTSPV